MAYNQYPQFNGLTARTFPGQEKPRSIEFAPADLGKEASEKFKKQYFSNSTSDPLDTHAHTHTAYHRISQSADSTLVKVEN